MTPDADDRGGQDQDDYDPFEYVPDRIDAVTASGLAQVYDALADRNRRRLASLPIEQQGVLLWNLVEQGAVNLDVTTEAGDRR